MFPHKVLKIKLEEKSITTTQRKVVENMKRYHFPRTDNHYILVYLFL
jgi:hypothetical protein